MIIKTVFSTLCCLRLKRGSARPLALVLALALAAAPVAAGAAAKGAVNPVAAEAVALPMGNLSIHARFFVDLPEGPQRALSSGVPLSFKFSYRLAKPKALAYKLAIGKWFDDSDTLTKTLRFSSLTGEYRVADPNGTKTYPTLDAALRDLGEVRGWTVLSPGSISGYGPSEVSIAVRLDLSDDDLPQAFRIDSYGEGFGGLGSGWATARVIPAGLPKDAKPTAGGKGAGGGAGLGAATANSGAPSGAPAPENGGKKAAKGAARPIPAPAPTSGARGKGGSAPEPAAPALAPGMGEEDGSMPITEHELRELGELNALRKLSGFGLIPSASGAGQNAQATLEALGKAVPSASAGDGGAEPLEGDGESAEDDETAAQKPNSNPFVPVVPGAPGAAAEASPAPKPGVEPAAQSELEPAPKLDAKQGSAPGARGAKSVSRPKAKGGGSVYNAKSAASMARQSTKQGWLDAGKAATKDDLRR